MFIEYLCKFIQFIVSKAGKLTHLEKYKKNLLFNIQLPSLLSKDGSV